MPFVRIDGTDFMNRSLALALTCSDSAPPTSRQDSLVEQRFKKLLKYR
jgi:hypothetical protein